MAAERPGAIGMTDTAALAAQLIRRPSLTPSDAGCQVLIAERLQALGFRIEPMRFGQVDNLWARRGDAAPVFTFAGHTDVVPPGPPDRWQSDPFEPTLREGRLYGRGAADMKGSLAAMVVACERFLVSHPRPRGSIALLLTSDEEGIAVDGTRRVMQALEQRGERIDWCLVGEPSSERVLGDTIKNGRRGSLQGLLRLYGLQGHVAYPHLAANPIHRAGTLIDRLAQETWDQGNESFPPTTFQVSNIHAGTGADNVIPGELELRFNLRFSTASSAVSLQQRIRGLIAQLLGGEPHFSFDLQWTLSGEPFLTPAGELLDATLATVREVLGRRATLSTGGGTSDGRFIAPSGAEVVELGPVNSTIHKANEYVDIEELEQLSTVYAGLLQRLVA